MAQCGTRIPLDCDPNRRHVAARLVTAARVRRVHVDASMRALGGRADMLRRDAAGGGGHQPGGFLRPPTLAKRQVWLALGKGSRYPAAAGRDGGGKLGAASSARAVAAGRRTGLPDNFRGVKGRCSFTRVRLAPIALRGRRVR